MEDTRSKTLITVEQLHRLLQASGKVVLLDVLDQPGAEPEDRLKIPGALSVNLERDFSGTPTPSSGRRPLPSLDELQAKARQWGICKDSTVIVYDSSAGAQASRAWWTLKWAGVPDVRVLDGGFPAWASENRPTTNHQPQQAAKAGDIVLVAGSMPTIGADEAQALAAQSMLLDARGKAAYVGDPTKSRTGHIPGALHAASTDNIADGKFLPDGALRSRFSALGLDGSSQVGVYCGSGNAATHAAAALACIGITAAVYVGSWSAWSADESRPVAPGPAPG